MHPVHLHRRRQRNGRNFLRALPSSASLPGQVSFSSSILTFQENHKLQLCCLRCSDFLRLFLDLERPEMSNEMTSNFELCGSLSSIDKSYFSTNRSLIIEFHSENEQSDSSGFKARYRFLEKCRRLSEEI